MSEKEFDAVVVGFSTVDVFLMGVPTEAQQLAQMFDNGSVKVRSAVISPGGDALNESTVLAKLGNKVKLVTGVGEDDPRAIIEKRGRDVGFDISDLVTNASGKTLLSIVLAHDNGQHDFLTSAANADIEFPMKWEAIKQGKLISLASLFLPPFDDPEVVYQTARIAKEAGAIVTADCCFPKSGTIDRAFLKAFPYIDYFLPNEEESVVMTGASSPEEAGRILHNWGIRNVVAKVGAKGCYLINEKGSKLIPAYKVENVVDTTGAGDNFAAGLIHALLRGCSAEEACRFASGVAAVSVQAVGASVGVRNLAQVEEAIKIFEREKQGYQK